MDYISDSAGAVSFGIAVRGSFESTVSPIFMGRGPINAFLRKYYNVGVTDFINLLESYVCTVEKSK